MNNDSIFNENTEKLKIKINGLKTKLDKAVSEYATAKKTVIEESKGFSDISQSKYNGNIIKLSNGILGYITDKGYFKYISNQKILKSILGKRGCASKVIELNGTSTTYDKPGKMLGTTPDFYVGKPMKENESCGFSGTNVKLGEINNTVKYIGCYKDNTYEKQTGLPTNVDDDTAIQNCMSRAKQLDSKTFYMTGTDCYVATNTLNKTPSTSKKIIKNVFSTEKKSVNTAVGILKTGELAVGEIDPNATSFENATNLTIFTGATPIGKCSNNPTYCSVTRLELLDNGTVFIRDSAGNTIWESNTKGNVGVPIKRTNSKYGRNYIETGEFLMLNRDVLESPSGNIYFALKSAGNIFHVQILADENNCGKLGNPIVNNYTQIRNRGSWGNDINNKTGISVDECKTSCNDLNDCAGFSYNKSERKCYLKNSGMYPNSALTKSDAYDTYTRSKSYGQAAYEIQDTTSNKNAKYGDIAYITRDGELKQYPDEMLIYDNNYTKIDNYTTINNDLKHVFGSTVEECKDLCNSQKNCDGFVYKKSKRACYTKNKGMYPNAPKQWSEDHTIYKRNKQIKSKKSCNKKINIIDADRYENYWHGSQMKPDSECLLGSVTYSAENNLENKESVLAKVVNEIKDEINKLNNEEKQLTKELNREIEKINREVNKYDIIKDNIKSHNRHSIDMNAMEQDSELNMLANSLTFTLWTTIATALIIGGVSYYRN